MTSEAPGATEAADRKCPLGDTHIHRDQVRAIFRECQEESFWYRALPLSLGGLAVTGALLYNGVLVPSKRFGPFPKLAVADQDSGGMAMDHSTGDTVTMCAGSVRETSQLLRQREHKADQDG
ncbi:hypothetical protein AGOR_G00197570 [Albula goreensis]|uniref:OCIA domain-containing protein n=1 Tax=Albula goreensis TaxID=1534307 RepID=A0A8T3CN88_9TELE|nr:hypothetical protein AGOR_G00197570 [Albula goreensis]